MNRDLTVGNPGAVLRRFCLPLFGSVIFQQLYNIADSLVAGKFIGESALAAVGNSYEITLLFIAFAFGCNIGCSVVVSQLFGGRAYGEMKTAVTTTLIAAGALCLELIRTPEEVMDASRLYLDIYLWGLPFLFFYNIATGIFSALGDSRTPFLFLALSSTANIGVDILFVTAFDMGVAGVAWATFLCQGVSCLLALAVVFRRLARIPAEGRRPLFSASALGRVAAIAVPSILQQSFISVGNIVIQGAINGFGTGVMAGYSAGVKLNNLVVTSFTTLGNGVSNFTAQNLGAGKTERIDQGFRAGLGLVWAVCLAYLLAGRQLLCLFIDAPTQTALDTGVTFLRLLSPFYFVVSAKLTADGVLRGTGSMGRFMAATFTDLILRVTLALVPDGPGGHGDLAGLAHRLDRGHGPLPAVLPHRALAAAGGGTVIFRRIFREKPGIAVAFCLSGVYNGDICGPAGGGAEGQGDGFDGRVC